MRHFILTTASDISQACVKSLTNMTPTAFPPFVFGDAQSEELAFITGPGTLASFTGSTLRVTIGDVSEGPTGGTYTVTVGANTTDALAYNTTTDALETAINALASVSAVGSINVVGAFPTFLLYWDSVGASKPTVSVSTALLEPDSAGSVSVLTAGSATVRECVGMSLRALPAAVVTSWTEAAGIWTGTINTNTQSAAALLLAQGEQVGEYLVANTVLSIAVSSAGSIFRTYYQGACQLRARNTDLSLAVPATGASYMVADANGHVVTPSNFNVLAAQLPTTALTGILYYTAGVATVSNVTNDSQVKRSEMGAASGVATLGTDSKLTASQIPDITVSDYLGSVATQAAMLLLVGQLGDWCIRTDLGTTWIITGADPTQLSSWTQLSYPAAPVSSVFGRTGSVTAQTGDYTAAQVGAATAAQGATADTAVQPAAIANMVTAAAVIGAGAIVVGSGGARGTVASTLSGIPVLTAGVPSASSVTNDAQTKASIVPNTAPAAGEVLVGSGTAYAKQAISGDATLASTGALTVNSTNGINLPSALASRAPKQMLNFDGTAGAAITGSSFIPRTGDFSAGITAKSSASSVQILFANTGADSKPHCYIDASSKIGLGGSTISQYVDLSRTRKIMWVRQSGVSYLFVDGSLIAQSADTTDYTQTINVLGANVGGNYFAGNLADFVFINRSLIQSEITNLTTTGLLPADCFPSVAAGTQIAGVAVNGTGGGSREFESFTGASATGFTGTDTADTARGYFPCTIVKGTRYRVGAATLTQTNGALNTFFTASGRNYVTDTVQEIINPPVAGVYYEFTATANASYIGYAMSFLGNPMSLVVAGFTCTPLGATAYFPDSGCGDTSWSGINGVTLTYDGVAVKRAIPAPDVTMVKGLSATSGTLVAGAKSVHIVSTLNSGNGTEVASLVETTGSGSGTGTQTGFRSDLLSGYAGNQGSFAAEFVNYSSGTGSNVFSSVGNFALRGVAHPNDQTTNSTQCGTMGQARWGSINFGLFGLGTYSNGAGTVRNGTTQYGVAGIAQGDATATIVGGYFGLYNAAFYPVRAALNAVTTGTDPIFVGRTDNVTKASIDYQGNTVLAGTATIGGQTLHADGSTTAPGIAFTGSPNMGFVRQTATSFDSVASDNTIVRQTGVASANRYIQITNAAGGGTPFIAADGGASTTLALKTNNASSVATTAITINGTQDVSLASTTAATAVNTGAIKNANLGISGTLGGASFFGGDLTVGASLGVGVNAIVSSGLYLEKSITASTNAHGVFDRPTLIASANNDGLYALRILPTYTVGAYTGTTAYGISIANVSGGATNYAIKTGTGLLSFGDSATFAGSLAVGGDLTQDGQAARSHSLLRNVTANTAGNNLTIQAGGATVAATDKDGGRVIIAPGLSTGTAKSSVRIQRSNRAASTGTTDNALVDGYILPSVVTATAEGSINLFEVALPAGAMAGGFITFQITGTDGTDLQVHSGHATYAAINKGGVYNLQITDEPATDDANAASAGALTDTWAITAGTNKVTISVTVACSVISANDIRIYYTVHNGSNQAVTQL